MSNIKRSGTFLVKGEDTLYFVTRLDDDHFILSNGAAIDFADSKLDYQNGAFYLDTTNSNHQKLRAKFLSAPYYEVLSNAHDEGSHYSINMGSLREKIQK